MALSNDVIKIPTELKSVIQYFLEWNQEFNEEGMRKSRYHSIRLSIRKSVSTISQILSRRIQFVQNYTYENFYTFSQSIPRNIPTSQVFYRYVLKPIYFILFILPKTKETVVDYEIQRIKV